ncbi:MAG TPA: RteC domain-containing protein [Puia sp.]|uniref:RteC domain-containing protein n=1 Tax=Puia sp. TaxID=2045100 RepID=UPI002CFA955B|nr:RteC domain-containing protein [Puia sp.]HVU98280.1 RteC domain-containing protein [Puia sp.]
MSPEYQEYYQQLLAVLHSHEDASGTDMERIEACFKSCLDQKPAFASHTEYYTFRYHAILFAPVNEPLELLRLRRWEEVKMQRFFEDNREFCRYIREGDTHHDAEYFRHTPGTGGNSRSSDLIHDPDLELMSPKDPLLTVMRAYELYGRYIHQQAISTLQTTPSQ